MSRHALALLAAAPIGTSASRNTAYRRAEVLWLDTLARRPGNGRSRINLASALKRQHRYGEALELPGQAPWRLGNLKTAKQVLDRALALKPEHVGARINGNNRAVALIALGRLDESRADVKTLRAEGRSLPPAMLHAVGVVDESAK